MSIHKILIVEDDLAFAIMLQGWFERNGFRVTLASRVEQAKDEILKNKFSLLLTDLRLPDGDGILLLDWIGERKINLPVIVMTSYGEIQSAVSAMKLGAEDFLEKPINPTILKNKIAQILEKKAPQSQNAEKKIKENVANLVVDKSAVAKQMYKYIRIVAPTKLSVLIMGESGTGKEYVARMIHENSTRKKAPFIAVDCGVLSKELAPSELFGHLKGSFTSAISDKKGVFELGNGGTIFLDEVGNLSYEVQMQLLRALQEQRVRAVGSAVDLSVDVRILTATNENLEDAIEKGRFREDLYHRLNEFTIEVPSLRERREDISDYAKHFLKQANVELEKNIKSFSAEALSALKECHWNGNLRELRNVVRRAALFTSGTNILPENLPILSHQHAYKKEEDLLLHPENEAERIETALKRAAGNKTLAAKLLNIDRKTLYNKMHRYGIKF